MFRLPACRVASLALTMAAMLSASAAIAQMSPAAMQMMKPCKPDYQKFCSTVERGGGRILACLQSHKSELSAACNAAMTKAMATQKGGANGTSSQ